MDSSKQENYMQLNCFSLLHDRYAFIDVPEYFADQLFIKHEVTVRFGREFGHPEHPFIIIFCKVRKRDTERFLAALGELDRKMILCGYPDYDRFCCRFMEQMKEKAEKRLGKGCKIDAACTADKAEQTCSKSAL